MGLSLTSNKEILLQEFDKISDDLENKEKKLLKDYLLKQDKISFRWLAKKYVNMTITSLKICKEAKKLEDDYNTLLKDYEETLLI